MAKQNINSKQGFTIIEVVLVLAIAGLIFLMVFVALPALQRSQRDSARRNDMSRVDTSLVQFQTNNSTLPNNLPDVGDDGLQIFWGDKLENNELPSDNSQCNVACQFVRDYMNSGASENAKQNEFEDPEGVAYSMLITKNWALADDAVSQVGTITVEGTDITTALTGDDTNGYTITGNNPFSAHMVYVVPGGRCYGEYVRKSQKRHFAVLYRLEGAGTYCIDDQ